MEVNVGIEWSRSAFDNRPLWRVRVRTTIDGAVEEQFGQWTDSAAVVNAEAEAVCAIWRETAEQVAAL